MPKPSLKDYRYFLDIWPELAKDHGGKFVAIKGRKVLGIYADYREAANAVYIEHERGTVLMQEIGSGPGSTDVYISTPGVVPVSDA